jgi:hypothetical protein
MIKITAWLDGYQDLFDLGLQYVGSFGCPANEFYFLCSKEDYEALKELIPLSSGKYKASLVC